MFPGPFFFFILMALFLVVVAPLWIVFHYITKWSDAKDDEPEEGKVLVDKADLEAMRDTAEKLDDRLANLEKLLDADAPGWREK